MKDRFRFRAWDNLEEKYIYDAQDQYDDKVECFGNMFDTYGGRYIVEQCTGLTDKNGKLIYEGDICSIKGYFYDCEQDENFDVDRIELVESLERFFMEAVFKGVCSALDCETLPVEVVGNIHENPDLLENKDVAED